MKATLRLLLLSCTLGPTSACAQTHTRAAGTPAPQAPLAPRVLGSGFQVGDRILLKVEGDSQFSDTFTVGPGPGLTLPVIGEIPLVGVRRADVEPYMSRELARYLKDPVVRAKALIRVSVVGEVQRPGFYSLPGDAVLADALIQAGGPTREARGPGVTIERGGEPILPGDSPQLPFAPGLTPGQAGPRGADRFVVARLALPDSERAWRVFWT